MVGESEAVTEHLVCRRPGVTTADAYVHLFTDPSIGRWLRPEPLRPFNPADLRRMAARDRAHWLRHGYGPWAVRHRESGDFVGRGGLAWATIEGRRQVELPWAVMTGFQNRGYATEMATAAIEVARHSGLERLVSLTLPDNLASRRVMEKAGLEFVGEIDHAGLPHRLYVLELGPPDSGQ